MRKTMNRIRMLLCLLMLSLTMMVLPSTVDASLRIENRIALVIGNNAYHEGPLENAVNDAKLIEYTMSQIGFKVFAGYDLDRTKTYLLIERFLAELTDGSVAFFYFAGVGKELDGRNYLLPIDVRFTPEGVRADGLALDQLQLRLDALARTKLLFIDACRDNWLGADSGSNLPAPRIGRPGPETFIGFATESGKSAFDGSDGHSPFAKALAVHLAQPGLEIGPMFVRVRLNVAAETGDIQQPASFSSLTNTFYFLPVDSTVGEADIERQPKTIIPSEPKIEAPRVCTLLTD